MVRLTSIVLVLLSSGCVSLEIERIKEGLPPQALRTAGMKAGKTTRRQALALLGPPDLLLEVDGTDRAYWYSWNRMLFKIVVKAIVPSSSGASTVDAFITGWGDEELHLVRLDFSPDGVLADVPRLLTRKRGFSSYYFAIDDRIVTGFLEDRKRALRVDREERADPDAPGPRPGR